MINRSFFLGSEYTSKKFIKASISNNVNISIYYYQLFIIPKDFELDVSAIPEDRKSNNNKLKHCENIDAILICSLCDIEEKVRQKS